MRPLGVIVYEEKCSLFLPQSSCAHCHHLIETQAFSGDFSLKFTSKFLQKTNHVFTPRRGRVSFCPVKNAFHQFSNRANILCIDFTWPLLLLSLPSQKPWHCVVIALSQSKASYSVIILLVLASKSIEVIPYCSD